MYPISIYFEVANHSIPKDIATESMVPGPSRNLLQMQKQRTHAWYTELESSFYRFLGDSYMLKVVNTVLRNVFTSYSFDLQWLIV